MQQRISAIAVAMIVATLLMAFPARAAADAACPYLQAHTSGCPTVSGSIGNGGVDLSGSQDGAGTGAGTGSGNGSGTGSGSNNTGGGRPGGTGGSGNQTPPPRDGYTVTMPGDALPQPITLADLVNFRPHAAIHRMEPNGWMVVGLATNFYAESSADVLDGQLLGRPASVRFTPRAYHWTYGDGTAATLATKGASWAALRIAEFDPTPTSHVFRTPGAYTITLSVDVGAEYRFDGGSWNPIAGTLPVAANPLVASAGDARTVLVEQDCLAHPSDRAVEGIGGTLESRGTLTACAYKTLRFAREACSAWKEHPS